MRSPQTIAMDLVNALPGCSCSRFSLVSNTALETRVTGWSPSLHKMGLAWAAVPDSLDPDGIAAALGPYMTVQRRRAELARSLGLYEQPLPDDLRHVVADRLLMRLNLCLRSDVARRTARFIQISRPGRDTVITIGDMMVADAGALDGDTAEDRRPRLLLTEATEWGEFDGRSLRVMRTVPESAVVSMPGRRVGEIIDFGGRLEPELADLPTRAVTAARIDRTGALVLETACDWTPLV